MDYQNRIDELKKEIAELEKLIEADPIKILQTVKGDRPVWRVHWKSPDTYLTIFYDEASAKKCADAIRRALELATP